MKRYIVFGIEYDLFAPDVELGLEALLEGGVGELQLERSAIGQPVAEEQPAAIHPVVARKLEIENTHARLLFGETAQESSPVLLAGPHDVDHLHR
jgi:hypothetical protein